MADSMRTDFADLSYQNEKDVEMLIWRISGKKAKVNEAKIFIDRIIMRAYSILELNPDKIRIMISVKEKYEKGYIAHYDYSTNIITVYADRVTDGVLAHEVVHAILSRYFLERLPSRIQEIIAQYVDKHLWLDY